MASHRPRKRTLTNQKKREPKKEKSRRKEPMNAVQHSPCAKSAARGGAEKELASPQTVPEVRGRWTCAHCCAISLQDVSSRGFFSCRKSFYN